MTKTGALFTKCFVWLGRIHRKNRKDPKHFLNLLTIFFFVQTSKATTKEIEVMTDVWKYYVLYKTFTTFLLFWLRGARSVDTLIKYLLVQNARNVPPTLVDLLTCLFFFIVESFNFSLCQTDVGNSLKTLQFGLHLLPQRPQKTTTSPPTKIAVVERAGV